MFWATPDMRPGARMPGASSIPSPDPGGGS